MKLVTMPAVMKKVDAQRPARQARAFGRHGDHDPGHISRVRYAHLQKSYGTAAVAVQCVASHTEAGSRRDRGAATSQQVLIREEMNALLADAKLDMAYADLQNAYANVYASLGLDPFPAGSNTDASVSTWSRNSCGTCGRTRRQRAEIAGG